MFNKDEVEFYLEDLRSKFNKIDPQKYVLAYSGGRDSELLRVIIKDYLKLPIEIVAVNTRMEFPEIVRRMMKHSDKVLIPEKTIYQIKEEFGSPCFNKQHDEMIYRYQNNTRTKNTMQYITGIREDGQRTMFQLPKYARAYVLSDNVHRISNKCCDYLKKKPMHKYLKEVGKKEILAVRGSESLMRKTKYNSCFTKGGKFTPLHDLDDVLFLQIEEYLNIEVPEIYNHVTRTGCTGCVYGKTPMVELNLLPKNRAKYVYECFKESFQATSKDINKEEYLDLWDKIMGGSE